MSGHSKWANIKNRKGAQDKKRSVAFTKCAKDIMVAVRLGGGVTDPAANPYLRSAIDKARGVDMPKENIERLLANFDERKANLSTVILEGFGPFGVPMVIETETDNKNRTLSEIKSLLKTWGCSLGNEGSVMFQFDRVGEIELEKIPPEMQLDIIDQGALDMDLENNTVIVDEIKVGEFRKKMEEMGLIVVRAGVVLKPKVKFQLEVEENRQKVVELVEILEENEDVINVFCGL